MPLIKTEVAMTVQTEKATLLLADGSVFEGRAFGARREAVGETVFTTGMTGYIETLTDPGYYGQIVVQTFPLIGNYGMMADDCESAQAWVSGYVVREWCDLPSNFRCEDDLDSFLKEQNIPGLCGIDTRRLTKILRESGVMNGLITTGEVTEANKPLLLARLAGHTSGDAVERVSCESPRRYKAENAARHVALLDFGCRKSIVQALQQQGCEVTVLPGDTPPDQLLALNPDGILLSNGPGNPAQSPQRVAHVQALMQSGRAVFGIGLGHQLMALAAGAKTEKLKYGHRGDNQPVRDIARERVYITSQNHGYVVAGGSLPTEAGEISHINTNDGSCEGVRYRDIPAFSVQFHPEACGIPQDGAYLFGQFIKLMEEAKSNAAE